MQQFCMCSMLSGKNFTLRCGSPGNSPKFDINPLTSYGCMSPHGWRSPRRRRKSFSSQVQQIWIERKSISQGIISCALPKTKPVGDDLWSTCLWPTDDDDEIKSKFQKKATKFEKCKFIFIKTFSLPLPSSLLKLPNARKWTGGGEAWAQLKIDWCI